MKPGQLHTPGGEYAARGVHVGIGSALMHVFGEPSADGRCVAVQGAGQLGEPLIRRLSREGARVVVADPDPNRLRTLKDLPGVERMSANEIYDVQCDVFAPCATGRVLNRRTIPRLRCRIVAGGANDQLHSDICAELLMTRGIVYAPDFVINAGGAIAVDCFPPRALQTERELAVDAIGPRLQRILAEARARRESPLSTALRYADEALRCGPHPAPLSLRGRCEGSGL